MGDSAGGGLAAALSILTRERGGPAIARQILLMPMLDDRTTTPDPHIEPYLLWSYEDSRTAWWRCSATRRAGRTCPPRRLRPASRTRPGCPRPTSRSASSTPSATRTSPTRPSSAGPAVPVEFHLHPGVPHEFDSIAFTTDVARRAIADRVRVLASL